MLAPDVGRKETRSAAMVVRPAFCADLSASVEDDPDRFAAGALPEPEAGRLGFAARNGVVISRIARGVVSILPATVRAAKSPSLIAVRRLESVSEPCGKTTATALYRVMGSLSDQRSGAGRWAIRMAARGI